MSSVSNASAKHCFISPFFLRAFTCVCLSACKDLRHCDLCPPLDAARVKFPFSVDFCKISKRGCVLISISRPNHANFPRRNGYSFSEYICQCIRVADFCAPKTGPGDEYKIIDFICAIFVSSFMSTISLQQSFFRCPSSRDGIEKVEPSRVQINGFACKG